MQKKKDFILLDINKPWVEYCSQNFFQLFCSASFSRSNSIANCMRFSSIRLWQKEGVVTTVTSEQERSYRARARLHKMVNRCVAAGCSNTPSDRVSLFKFPNDGVLRHKWEKQVQRTRAQWKATEHSYLCSYHFTEDCFEVNLAFASQFGIKKRRLKPGAVPTVFH